LTSNSMGLRLSISIISKPKIYKQIFNTVECLFVIWKKYLGFTLISCLLYYMCFVVYK
jgi:hypothetical protein